MKYFAKIFRAKTWYMNPWSWQEIAVLGGGTIQTSLRLIGKALTTFHSEPTPHPLYLWSDSLNFAAVGTPKKPRPHAVFPWWLVSQGLQNHAAQHVPTQQSGGRRLEALEVVYCIIGVLLYPVQNLVADANTTLSELKKLSPQKLSKEPGIPNIANAHAKLSMFRVVGCTFHYQEGFKEVKYRV
ncbi:hypothetical protein B0H14DRAFT_1068272 [Mycena olivaceomarginata]|nr:hypothetical protein B0H14DRAFT_1068272 [Mycena olivaceomarginata]